MLVPLLSTIASSGAGVPATQVDGEGSTATLQALTGVDAGSVYYNTTTYDLWVFDGNSVWFIFNNDS